MNADERAYQIVLIAVRGGERPEDVSQEAWDSLKAFADYRRKFRELKAEQTEVSQGLRNKWTK